LSGSPFPRGKSRRRPTQQTANDAGYGEVIQFGFKIASCRRSCEAEEAEKEAEGHRGVACQGDRTLIKRCRLEDVMVRLRRTLGLPS